MTYSLLDGWWTDAGTFDSLLRAANLVAQYGAQQGGPLPPWWSTVDDATASPHAAGAGLPPAAGPGDPECAKGIGSVIVLPGFGGPDRRRSHAALLTLWPDDRGYFLEVQRIGRDWPRTFRPRPRRSPRR